MDIKKIIILAIILVVVILSIIFITNNKDEEIYNNDGVTIDPIATLKKTDKYEIYNTNIKAGNGITKITTTVKNVSTETAKQQKIVFVLIDKNNNEVAEIPVIIPKLDAGKTTKINSEALTEYANIYDFKIK